MLVVGGNGSSISALYPRFTRWNRPGIHPYSAGDKVRITGIASSTVR